MIEDGLYQGGDRLEEVEISERIGVSRTPVREALIALEGDGLVQSSPNRGFVVTAANAALVREIYPILGALECAGLRLAAPSLGKLDLDELDRINNRLASAATSARQYEFDAAFHARLVRDCGNNRLLRLLKANWMLARRIDGAYRRGTANHDGSVREHAAIVGCLRLGELNEATERLAQHWRSGEHVVVSWLDSQR